MIPLEVHLRDKNSNLAEVLHQVDEGRVLLYFKSDIDTIELSEQELEAIEQGVNIQETKDFIYYSSELRTINDFLKDDDNPSYTRAKRYVLKLDSKFQRINTDFARSYFRNEHSYLKNNLSVAVYSNKVLINTSMSMIPSKNDLFIEFCENGSNDTLNDPLATEAAEQRLKQLRKLEFEAKFKKIEERRYLWEEQNKTFVLNEIQDQFFNYMYEQIVIGASQAVSMRSFREKYGEMVSGNKFDKIFPATHFLIKEAIIVKIGDSSDGSNSSNCARKSKITFSYCAKK